MGNHRPIPTRCWEKFLKSNGFNCIRVKGSHYQWTKPNSRSIPVWGSEKEIPANHLKTGCFTIGCSVEYLLNWAKNNC